MNTQFKGMLLNMLVFGHFPMILEFGEENKLALKFNFTYWERISTQKSDSLK
jgi:hypothetical protein